MANLLRWTSVTGAVRGVGARPNKLTHKRPWPDLAAATVGAMMGMMRKLGAIATVAMTLMFAACTSSTSPHRTTTGLIAWTSTPAPATTTTTLAPAPVCTKSDLRVQFLGFGAAASMFSDVFQLTNIGKATCRLQGHPQLFPSVTSGKPVPRVFRHSYLPVAVGPGNIAPKVSGYVIIGGTDNCPPAPGGSRVKPVPYKYAKVVLPNGEGSFITSEMPPCVPVSLSIGVNPPEPALPPPGSLAALDVTIDMPASIRAGHVLHYTVVLSNPRQVYGPSGEEANRTVLFAPCPGYTESLDLYVPGHLGQEHIRTYKLNCGPVGQLGPGKSARFAMELPVPKVSKAIPAAVGWDVNINNGTVLDAATMYQSVKVYP